MSHIRHYMGKISANIGIRSLKLRKILCILIAFLISILFVSIALLTALRWSFSLDYIKRVMATSNYYDNLLLEIESDAKMITLTTGLPVEVLEGVFQTKEVQDEVNLQLENTFKNGDYQNNPEKIESRLRDNVERYLEEKTIIQDEELSQSINEYISMIINDYNNSLRIPILDRMLRFIGDNQMLYFVAISIITGILLSMMIAIFNLSSSIHRLLFYSYNSALAAALILVFLSKVLITDRFRNQLQKASNSFNELLIVYIDANLQNLYGISVVLMLLSIALLLGVRITKSKSIKMV